MTTITRTFTVDPPPPVVLDYLKDFTRAEVWDPGTRRCVRLDEGPIRVGSTWHNESKIAGISTELVYELIELGDSRVVFAGSNKTAETTDAIEVRSEGSGSRITYTAEVTMRGVAKLGTPVVKLVFEKIGIETEDNLVAELNRR